MFPFIILPSGVPRLQMMRGPPVAPPLPRPPPPPPVGLPPALHGPTSQETSQPIQHISVSPQVVTELTVQLCRRSFCGVSRMPTKSSVRFNSGIRHCVDLGFKTGTPASRPAGILCHPGSTNCVFRSSNSWIQKS